MGSFILALDQGTTSSRAILFDRGGRVAAMAQQTFPQHYPQPGWVEHDPLELWESQRSVAAQALRKLGPDARIAGIGITNQRETTILWDKATGEPVYNAIVWQCRRTAGICDKLKETPGMAEYDRGEDGTGHRRLLLRHEAQMAARQRSRRAGARRARRAALRHGGNVAHLASHRRGRPCDRLLQRQPHNALQHPHAHMGRGAVPAPRPMCLLPRPVSNSEIYGTVVPGIEGLEALAGIPVCGAAGDQQSALFGQGCHERGQAKNTYGTGCFTLMNVGGRAVRSRAGLVTSVAWSLGGKTIYALEGSVFNAGSAIQWLRDELGLIGTSHECDLLAESVPDAGGVYLVPAFTGLGAPYWDMYARGCIVGVTRGTTRAHIARAVLEAIAFEVTDLMNAMRQDAGCEITVLRVDGGASVSDVMLRFQSDLLRIPVDRPQMVETTAFGAAALAGLAVGFWQSMDEVRALRVSDRVFSPERAQAECDEKYRLWKRAVSCACGWIEKA